VAPGNIIRFGPNEISINTATALQDIYGSRKANVQKSDWYHAIQLAGGGANTFSATDRNQHAQKRRLLSHAFSETALRGAEPHILEQVQKWCVHLGEGAAKDGWTEGKNMAIWGDYLTFDVLSDLCFGKPFGVLDYEENRFIVSLVPNAAGAGYVVSV
jgi:cytochrome P450